MPSINEHLEQVSHNLRFVRLLRLASRCFPDWLITGQFYTAVHVVDAYLATKGIHPPAHRLRGQYIYEDTKLRPIYSDYQDLSNLSRDARYSVRLPSKQDLRDCSQSLSTVQLHVNKLL